MEMRSRWAFVAVLVIGLVGTGLLVRVLNAADLFEAGVVTWILGYGATVLLLWYGWVRPLDITGPTDSAQGSDGDDHDGV